jgi:hypothetical protein
LQDECLELSKRVRLLPDVASDGGPNRAWGLAQRIGRCSCWRDAGSLACRRTRGCTGGRNHAASIPARTSEPVGRRPVFGWIGSENGAEDDVGRRIDCHGYYPGFRWEPTMVG